MSPETAPPETATPQTGPTQDGRTPAVVLLSGGLDSSTCLAIAQSQGFELYALSFAYGQRHEDIELTAARNVAAAFDVKKHLIINFDMRAIGGSALTADIDVPKGRDQDAIGGGVPMTYVPARNTVFLSFALAWAETLKCTDMFIGVNALDYSGYPDCRPEFIEAFEKVARLGTALGAEDGRALTIHAPLMTLDKRQIIERGLALGVDYSQTHTCYDPADDGRSCGACDACILRKKGFAEANRVDPIAYSL